MHFSDIEIEHLSKGGLAISLAFAILLSKQNNISLFSQEFGSMFVISIIAVGSGFLLHELGHKYVAQKNNCFAEFRSFDFMLILAILMSFFGFIIAAPGAVMIGGHYISKRINGLISVAGPIINILLAILFMGLLSLEIFPLLSKYGALINSWLAVFNMIPVWNLDGKKVLKWNKFIYFSTMGIAIVVLFLAMKLGGFQ